MQPGSGTVLQSPKLVTVTFAGYEFQKEMEDFGAFLAGSQWLKTIGAEYGVGAGTSVNARLPDQPPPTLDKASLASLLSARIDDGTLPAPDVNTLYVVYTSSVTWFQEADGSICSGFHGNHQASGTSSQGTHFGFLVVPDCFGELDVLTVDASQNVADAVVDPLLDSYRMAQPSPASSPSFQGAGDACQTVATVSEGGHPLGRSWSNANATRGANPCIPAIDGEVYYGLTASAGLVQMAAPGTTVTIDLTGWSDGAVNPWVLVAVPAASDFDPAMLLSASTVTNGGHVTATFNVPQASPGQVGLMELFSFPLGSSVILGVVVQ
jgi:hypothetical protein